LISAGEDGTIVAMRSLAAIVIVLAVALGACAPSSSTSLPPPPDVAAPPADAARTPSGLASKVLQVGMSNVRPGPRNRVRVHYTGWTPDGKMFDSSVVRGTPAEFGVTNVIPGWTEGLQLMVVGEKRRFWIPGHLAYDGGGGPPGAPTGMLVFDVELIAVE
jgi:peptidylprolyl isomerase